MTIVVIFNMYADPFNLKKHAFLVKGSSVNKVNIMS